MVNRQKAKELPFSTLRFLKISVEKTRRRKRIHDVLLMVLRAAVLMLIAAGLARPAVTSLGALVGRGPVRRGGDPRQFGQHGHDRPGPPRFETATAAASQIFDQLSRRRRGGAAAHLRPARSPMPTSSHRTQDAVRQILAQCRVSYERADLGGEVERARELLGQVGSPQQADLCLDRHAEDLVGTFEGRGEGERGERRGERQGRTRASRQALIPHPQSLSSSSTAIASRSRTWPSRALTSRRPCRWPACR